MRRLFVFCPLERSICFAIPLVRIEEGVLVAKLVLMSVFGRVRTLWFAYLLMQIVSVCFFVTSIRG
jgi:hypothetical protein